MVLKWFLSARVCSKGLGTGLLAILQNFWHGNSVSVLCLLLPGSEFSNFSVNLIFLTDIVHKRNLYKWQNQKPLVADYTSKKKSPVCVWLLIFLVGEREDEQWKGHLISLLVQDTNRKTALFCLQLNMSSEAGKLKSTALKCRLLIKYIIMLVVTK